MNTFKEMQEDKLESRKQCKQMCPVIESVSISMGKVAFKQS